jgi:hypothetical protein
MSPGFHVDTGPITIDVRLDDSGIHFERNALGRSHTESIPWGQVTGATLVCRAKQEADDEQEQERMAQFLGPQAVQKFHELQGKLGQIFVAYRDKKNRLQQTELPALLTDSAYLQEFQNRLGSRWLGETPDRQQVDKKLHTNPGFFKTIFVLVALLGIVAAIAAVGFLGFLGPILNLMSIQKMLLDLQDGNFVSFSYRVASYVALFFMAYLLQRVIRAKLDAMKRPRRPRPTFQP